MHRLLWRTPLRVVYPTSVIADANVIGGSDAPTAGRVDVRHGWPA